MYKISKKLKSELDKLKYEDIQEVHRYLFAKQCSMRKSQIEGMENKTI